MAQITLPPIQGPGPLGTADPNKATALFSKLIGSTLTVIFVIAGLFSFIQFILGGFDLISSGGDKAKVQKGRERILWAIVGFVVLLSAWALIFLLQGMTGICLGFNCDLQLPGPAITP